MRQDGLTLVEVMVAMSVLAIVMAMLFVLAVSFGNAAATQDTRSFTQDEASIAMEHIVTELRQAASGSINWTALPGPSITYEIPTDLDGNGTAVDDSGYIELTTPRTIGRGANPNQVVLTHDNQTKVLTNDVLTNEDVNNNGVLDAGEDTNGNHVLDRGIWFQKSGNGIEVLLQTQRRPKLHSPYVTTTLTETVVPRN